MKFKGRVWKFKDDVNTDEIIPARYLNTSIPSELVKHVMEDIDPNFVKKMKAGDIIVAGKNFGCGSSREHAPLAIKSAGISCIVAKSFARIFYRNSFNIGLPIIENEEVVERVKTGDELEINIEKGLIKNLTTNEQFKINPYPEFMQKLVQSGGLINFVKKTFI
jgi:3-isopropylmalate/(R)-2-methylmalate dehydratase small subunit